MPEALEPDPTITVESGVSLFTKQGFCILSVNGERVGQLDPSQVRDMAMGWLAAADAAESDAAVFAELTEYMELPEHTAAAFVQSLRARRES